MRSNILFVLIFLWTLQACDFSSSGKKNFKHNYPKYWEKYSDLELKDKLYADTLKVGPDADGKNTATTFYKDQIEKLLIELNRDKNKVDQLYPMADFDEVTASNGTFGRKKAFTDEQISRLLMIVNDPTSFNWSETTSEPDIQVAFFKEGKIVGILNIEADKLVVTPSPELLGFLKMKFGTLNEDSRRALIKLLAEVGF